MGQPARSARAERLLARLAPAELDELLQRAHRHAGIDAENRRLVGVLPDRHHVLHGIEGRLVHDRVDGVAAGDAEEGVTVGRRLDRGFGAEISAGARPVVDQHGLAEARRHLLGDEPRGEVGPAARRERHDELDRPRRPGLRRDAAGKTERCATGQKGSSADRCHGDTFLRLGTLPPAIVSSRSSGRFPRYANRLPATYLQRRARTCLHTAEDARTLRLWNDWRPRGATKRQHFQ